MEKRTALIATMNETPQKINVYIWVCFHKDNGSFETFNSRGEGRQFARDYNHYTMPIKYTGKLNRDPIKTHKKNS